MLYNKKKSFKKIKSILLYNKMSTDRFVCIYCNKDYSSKQTRSNHYYLYHKKDNPQNPQNSSLLSSKTPQNTSIIKIDGFTCKFCNKNLSRIDNMKRHEKNCKENKPKDELKVIEDELKITVDELVTDKIDKILKTMKIHPKTLQKINNQLINNNNSNNNSNNTVNNVINVIVPNIDHNLKEIFTKSEKMEVLTAGNEAHLKLTDILYKKPKYEKYRNVYITNLSNDIGYIYDKKENRFIVKSKKDILDDYGIERFSDIQYFYEELETRLDGVKLDKLKDMVKNYFNDKTFQDLKNKEMLISLYNNKVNVKKIYEIVNKEIKEIEL